MHSHSRVLIFGHVGREPRISVVKSGDRLGALSIAVQREWRSGRGEAKVTTDWIRCVVYDQPAVDLLERQVRSGTFVYLEGRLETRTWVDKLAQDRWTMEVVVRPGDGKLLVLENAPKPFETIDGQDF